MLLRVAVMLNATPFPNSLLQDVSITLFTKDVDDIVSEVNVFIYYLDQSFFDAYLASSLQSKVEKSFLDMWLIGGDVSCFLQPQFFERLNAFERALLASPMSEEEGATIELGMKNNTVHNPLSRFAFASIFQSAINLKSWNAPPSVLSPEEEEKFLVTLFLVLWKSYVDQSQCFMELANQ